MKTVSVLILVLFGTASNLVNNNDFDCKISTSKKVYKIGETPELKVSIANNSKKDVYLIGSLDGSEEKRRNPHCYFTIEKPKNDLLPIVRDCGNMNLLRKEDFKLIKAGESFNPYESIDGYGFFSSYEMDREENFQIPGKYKITFHYSTASTKISDYFGGEAKDLKELFSKVPHIDLKSNTIEIEIRE